MFSLDSLRALIADHLQRPLADVGPGARLVEDLAIESLEFYALLIEIEACTGVMAALPAVQAATTVEQLHAAVLGGWHAT